MEGVEQWNVEDVCGWIASFADLSQYVHSFQSNDIDGQCLLSLTMQELSDDLYITSLGHRKKLLRAIENLKSSSTQSGPLSSTPTTTTTTTIPTAPQAAPLATSPSTIAPHDSTVPIPTTQHDSTLTTSTTPANATPNSPPLARATVTISTPTTAITVMPAPPQATPATAVPPFLVYDSTPSPATTTIASLAPPSPPVSAPITTSTTITTTTTTTTITPTIPTRSPTISSPVSAPQSPGQLHNKCSEANCHHPVTLNSPSTPTTHVVEETVPVEDLIDLLETFPDEIKMRILSFIPQYDLLNSVQQISYKWKRLVLSDSLWHTICMSDFADVNIDKLLKMINIVNTSRGTVKKLVFDDPERKLLVASAKVLCKICPRIESLHVDALYDPGIRHLATELSDTITDLHYDFGFLRLYSRNLTSLSIRGYQDVNSIVNLGTRLTKLIWKRDDMNSVDAQNLMPVLSNCTRIEELDMSICNFQDAYLGMGLEPVFASLRNLREFRYSPIDFDPPQPLAATVPAAHVPSLSKLIIKCNARVKVVGTLDYLVHLNLSKCEIDDEAVAQFSGSMPNVKFMDVSFCGKLVNPVFNFSRLEKLIALGLVTTLKSLTLNCEELRDLLCNGAKKMHKLTLESKKMSELTLHGLTELEELSVRCPNLITFKFKNDSPTLTSVFIYAPILRTIEVSTVENTNLANWIPIAFKNSSTVTKAVLDSVASPLPLGHIKHLQLTNCILPSNIKLDEPLLTDLIMKDLKDITTLIIGNCPILKSIGISGCATLQALSASSRLEISKLSITNCPLLSFPSDKSFASVKELLLSGVHPSTVLHLDAPVLEKCFLEQLECQKIVFVTPAAKSIRLVSCPKLDQISFPVEFTKREKVAKLSPTSIPISSEDRVKNFHKDDNPNMLKRIAKYKADNSTLNSSTNSTSNKIEYELALLEITVVDCTFFTDDFFAQLPTSVPLHLTLDNQDFVNVTIALTNLVKLTIKECDMVWLSIATTSLKILEIEDTKYSTFNYSIPNIEQFAVRSCPSVPLELSRYHFVKRLELNNIKTNTSLHILTSETNMNCLEELKFFYMKTLRDLVVDCNTIKRITIAHCSPLMRLLIHSHSLSDLILIRNPWIQHLTLHCPELLSLSMPSTNRLSESSFAALHLSRVRYINMRWCPLSVAQIKQFPAKFPNARSVRLSEVADERTVKNVLRLLTGQTSLDPIGYDPHTDTSPDRTLSDASHQNAHLQSDEEIPDLVESTDSSSEDEDYY